MVSIKKHLLAINIFIKKHYLLIILGLFALLVFASMVKINVFRYNNYDMGKFDLGNMTQMAWYSLRGKFMYLTDYFGSNVPRWSMSHVDPILVIFLPFFAILPHPLTLVFAQNLLVVLSCFILYFLTVLKTKNKFLAFFISMAYLSYPALGFLLSWTGYHGVTPAIFFFFLFIYVYEKYKSQNVTLDTKKTFVLLGIAAICMSGKEQIPLYFIMTAFYIFVSSVYKKFAAILFFVSVVWFVTCFFVIIPHYASYRIASFENFINELGLGSEEVPNIYSSNYFLSRYSEFGDSYSEIIVTMLTNPIMTASVFLTGDKVNNLYLTFGPVLFINFLHPIVALIAFPDLLINYSTTQGGIGTSEIYNHRISMIIPVIFISCVYGLSFFISFVKKFTTKNLNFVFAFVGFLMFANSLYFSYYVDQRNPIFAWLVEAVNKRVFAKSLNTDLPEDLTLGKVYKINSLERNDRECVSKIIERIPPMVSVSGPDFMGGHLSLRETYAIFPANINNSDYLIVDVFSKKLLRILELDYSLNKDFLSIVLNNPNYEKEFVCGNFYVFKKTSDNRKVMDLNILPVQKIRNYEEKFSFQIFRGLRIVDYSFTSEVEKGTYVDYSITYSTSKAENLAGFVVFTSLIHKNTQQIFQFVHYPTYAYADFDSFGDKNYMQEKFKIKLPPYLENGEYMVFLGIDNEINSRSVYLGNLTLK